jgi:formylmethanofuran dehydrogenase subunit B
MSSAWINGNPAEPADAFVEAAALLGRSRLPVIAGLGADIAGARAAIALARRLGGAIDHVHSSALLRNLDVARQAYMLVTTVSEAGLRADILLLAGADPFSAQPDVAQSLLRRGAAGETAGTERRVFWLCPGSRRPAERTDWEVQAVGRDPGQLPVLLAALRARLGGRPANKVQVPTGRLDQLAAELKAARFGVAVWSAAELDVLTIEMLSGLVNDLNAETRFTGLPMQPGANAAGVLQTCGWTTGLPMRTGFGRGFPEHDGWLFDADRLVDSGEADCALWISAYEPLGPAWRRPIPTIALTGAASSLAFTPAVRIAVGRPGSDRDAVEYLPATDGLALVRATDPGGMLSVAEAVERIASHLPAGAPGPADGGTTC